MSKNQTKTLYVALRRASTKILGDGAIRRLTAASSIAATVPAARGMAAVRDAAAKAVSGARTPVAAVPPLDARLAAFVATKYSAIVAERGGETAISERSGLVPMRVIDRPAGCKLVLLGADGWRQYSRAFGARRASIRYLAGTDDNGPFAVRIPATVDSVAQAIDALMPAEVRSAIAEGRAVIRQGDVYVIALRRGRDNFSALPVSHSWDKESRTLRHAGETPHQALHVPFAPAKAVPQTALRMGRLTAGRRTGRGD